MIRTAHGAGASALVRVETAPVNELPEGVPAPAREDSPSDRAGGGLFARGNTIASEGGKARAGKTRLAARLGLAALADDAAFRPYKRSAEAFRRAQCTDLARTVGGGHCGPGPSSIVASAALSLGWSRYLSDLAATTGDADLALKSATLSDKSRQALLTATELCAREATARAKSAGPIDPLAAWRTPVEGSNK